VKGRELQINCRGFSVFHVNGCSPSLLSSLAPSLGLTGPDRRPHPSAIEAAALQATVLFSTLYAPSGDFSLAVRNKRAHTDLSDVTVTISLFSDVSSKGFKPKPVLIGEGSLPRYSTLYCLLRCSLQDNYSLSRPLRLLCPPLLLSLPLNSYPYPYYRPPRVQQPWPWQEPSGEDPGPLSLPRGQLRRIQR
jgi:hypothetical protein